MKSNHNTEFESMVAQHKSTIYSVCYMFVDSPVDADDLFQEVLINLWNGFSKFRGDSSLRSWVYRVSMNTCISYKRKKQVKTTPLQIDAAIFESDSGQSRQTEQLHQRILSLEPIDRAIVLLWLENLPYEEIAAIIGISVNAVGVRLVRIREKLKSL